MWKHEFTGREITNNQYQALTSYDKRNYYRVAQPVANQQEDEDNSDSLLSAIVNADYSSSEDNISNDTSSNDSSSDFGGFGGGDSGGAGASGDF